LFLFDVLQPVLDRSIGVITHSQYARDLVSMRCAGLPTWLIPLHARLLPERNRVPKSTFGFSDSTFLVGHVGFVTAPRRPELFLGAFRKLLDAGYDAHFVFVGQDETVGLLDQLLDQF